MRAPLRPARWLPVLAAATLALAGCHTDRLLEVDLPGKVPEESLDDPALAQTLVNGVIADLECAWDNYVAAAAVHSDEFIHSSGNLQQRLWGQRRITADDANFAQGDCAGAGYGLYTPLHTARVQAEDVYRRLAHFPDDRVPDKKRLQATARAYGGFALVALGEGFCEMVLDGGPILRPRQVLELAETRFTEAIELARQAARADSILYMALVGRARVRLDLEKFADAIEDASQVPPTFVRYATRDASDPRRYNTQCEWVNCPQWRHHTVAPSYRQVEWKGVPDPRVHVETRGQLGFDGVTPHYFHNKVTSRDSPVLLASYKEAQLFIAEAAARTGDLARARQILNERHRLAGLPPIEVADAPTQDDMIRLVIEERRRELFAEGGHRQNDHLRFRGTRFNVPFKGEPGSYHPNGIDHLGQPYGTTTCFPLPTVERQGNPNARG